MSALVEDLDQRGLLQDTAIIWMGEFSRTPRINGNAGRDHWARSWSVVVGGAGMKGGIAVGETNDDGTDGRDRALHLARRDGHGLQGPRHLAGNDLHQQERPPDEDRQQRQGDQRAVCLVDHWQFKITPGEPNRLPGFVFRGRNLAASHALLPIPNP